MLKKISGKDMFLSNKGWLKSRFHFSFAEYQNPQNMNFGVLRVVNDDIVKPQTGFEMHPHKNMEIISYVVNGEITHKDSMNNEETLKRGEVQYMSAGTGVFHSEHNLHLAQDLRLLQIWILPPQQDTAPIYGSHRYKKDERFNKLLHIVSPLNGDAQIKIHQDVNFYVSELEKDRDINFSLQKNRQLYFIQMEGSSEVNGVELKPSDAMEVQDEKELNIKAVSDSHFLFIEMAK